MRRHPCSNPGAGSIQARVETARDRQRERFEGTSLRSNADAHGETRVRPAEVREFCRVDDALCRGGVTPPLWRVPPNLHTPLWTACHNGSMLAAGPVAGHALRARVGDAADQGGRHAGVTVFAALSADTIRDPPAFQASTLVRAFSPHAWGWTGESWPCCARQEVEGSPFRAGGEPSLRPAHLPPVARGDSTSASAGSASGCPVSRRCSMVFDQALTCGIAALQSHRDDYGVTGLAAGGFPRQTRAG